jgi:hypothetical protein
MKEESLRSEIYETTAQAKNKIGRPKVRWEDQLRQAQKRRIQWNETK